MQKRRERPRLFCFSSGIAGALACLVLGVVTQQTMANPTQEEVFKSIQDGVGSKTDYRMFLVVVSVMAGSIILAALFGQRRKGEVVVKTVNHPGKLLKEIIKLVPIRPREIKQLKTLCEHTPLPEGGSVRSPLTLILCPSVLAKAVQNPRCKADRRVIQQVLRKSVATGNVVQAISASIVRSGAASIANEKGRQVAPGRPVRDSLWGR
jgi:hypothetical protein